ncbi:MAG: HD-GYP domain-containing protein [Pseudomonadota bacterium]
MLVTTEFEGFIRQMLLRIDTDRLRLGMFIESLDGSWLDSPFWRRRFLLEDRDDLDRLRACGVGVTIDTARGLGPAPVEEATATTVEILDERTVAPVEPVEAEIPAPPPPRRRVRLAAPSEIDRAKETVERSKQAVTAMFGEARMGHAVRVDAVAPLVDEIAASVSRDPSAMVKVTRLKSKNEYTYLHSVAVCALMINLGRHIGLDEGEIRTIGLAGLLHDIGKMAIPEDVLEKPGRLDDDEIALVRGHPEAGHAMLVDCPDVSAITLDVCLHHHERIDGLGYPFGLAGDDISLYARMGAICDVYDAVTSNRPYKRAWSANDALARMLEWEGHFDPALLQAFVASIGIHPTGGLVRLRSNRLALVIEGSDDEPTMPRVRAFYDIAQQRAIPPVDYATDGLSGAERILKAETGAYWFGDGWTEARAAVRAGAMPPPSSYNPARPYAATPRQRFAAAAAAVGRSLSR